MAWVSIDVGWGLERFSLRIQLPELIPVLRISHRLGEVDCRKRKLLERGGMLGTMQPSWLGYPNKAQSHLLDIKESPSDEFTRTPYI